MKAKGRQMREDMFGSCSSTWRVGVEWPTIRILKIGKNEWVTKREKERKGR